MHRPQALALTTLTALWLLTGCSDEDGDVTGTGGTQATGGLSGGGALATGGNGGGGTSGGDGDSATGGLSGDGGAAGDGDGDGDGDAPRSGCRALPLDTTAITCPSTGIPALRATELTTDLTRPVLLTSAPGDQSRLFVVQRDGFVRIVNPTTGAIAPTPFLNLSMAVATNSDRGAEYGLLGMAFHPDYPQDGRVFVNYNALVTNPDNGLPQLVTRVESYEVSSGDPDQLDPGSGEQLLQFVQPNFNHNGGMLAFGPDDCMYISTGDGGGANDPDETGQALNTPLGKMLRIDVDAADLEAPGNMDASYPHIWSYGHRNPWRFSFDRQTGALYMGDVGQGAYEEINVERVGDGGHNYGWKLREGNHCRGGGDNLESCGDDSMVGPVDEYGRTTGTCVIGGHVYRGSQIADLRGYYLYADHDQRGGNGIVRAFAWDGDGQRCGGTTEDLTEDLAIPGRISSFGQDAVGELYVTTIDGGLYRIEAE